VGESGWPYVQHRGGPPGFLKVLGAEAGASRLGWAVGNLGSSARVSLILMDYAQQQRLKILGEARSADARTGEAAALLDQVGTPGYRAHVERVVTVTVHGFDWNCPQHITPRWTRAELAPALDKLQGEIDDLRERNRRLEQEIAALRRS
jgi:predicted pyridoxine 5'-phosphate oxidase superfamily flavin-nucleotide-binding protein